MRHCADHQIVLLPVRLAELQAEIAFDFTKVGERIMHLHVELWPGWVDRVPELEWRIELRVESDPEPSARSSP